MKKLICVCFVVFMLLLTTSLQAQERVVISQAQIAPTAYRLMGERVLKEAYSRIGVELELEDLPAERALVYASEGKTDGEFARIAGIEQNYPNLVMISVPIVYEDIVVYSKEVDFTVDGWESLAPYSINFIRGFKLAEIKTEGMNVEMVNTIEQAFLKLNAGRTDVVVDLRSAQCVLPTLDVSGITALEPPLTQIVMYHYLNTGHKALAAKLEEELKRMAQDGDLKAIQEQAVQDFLNACQK